MGYQPGYNEPCVFVHPTTGHRVVLFCDDFLCRGSKQASVAFYEALARRFDCKDPNWLNVGDTLTFTGLDISLVECQGKLCYRIDQAKDTCDFLESKGLGSVPVRDCPMPDKKVLYDTEEVNDNLSP